MNPDRAVLPDGAVGASEEYRVRLWAPVEHRARIRGDVAQRDPGLDPAFLEGPADQLLMTVTVLAANAGAAAREATQRLLAAIGQDVEIMITAVDHAADRAGNTIT